MKSEFGKRGTTDLYKATKNMNDFTRFAHHKLIFSANVCVRYLTYIYTV